MTFNYVLPVGLNAGKEESTRLVVRRKHNASGDKKESMSASPKICLLFYFRVVDFRGAIEGAYGGDSSSDQEQRVLNSGSCHRSRHSASDSIQDLQLIARIQRCRGPDDNII
ncbi:unnamed protein product [Linum trigynum]|uniref:Uncharacterized protein n=1 Tax=Linum trigynum TaxID=586398 RepID=A0AAV2FAR2_9ROSI